MFFHNFKYALKTLFRNKMLIFWTFAFPIILGTFFNMAFSNIENSEKLDIIEIAIVEKDDFLNHETFDQVFKSLSDETNEDRLFATQYVTEEEAKLLLEKDEISGYLVFIDTPKVVVKKSGIHETILKYVTEEILQTEDIIKNVAEKKIEEEIKRDPTRIKEINSFYQKIYQEVVTMSLEKDVQLKDISNKNLSYMMIEFYTLIAMTCLYGGILGMVAINQNLANMSSTGKRISVAPTTKGKMIFSSVLASYVTQLIGIALLFFYTIVVLQVDYGNNLIRIVLLTLVGCLAGLSLGIVVATLLKTNENVKNGIIISVTMLGCFLSGMMGVTMKYVIDKNIPIVNQLNPASLITDGFYSLYYYETFDRFYGNILSLIIFALIMIGISIFSLRRQKYDSI